MPRHHSVVLISIVAHAILLAGIVLVSIIAPDVLPTPRTLLAWDAPRLVQMDIQLPPKPPAARPPGPVAPPQSANAAPLVAPEGVRAETGNEQRGPVMPEANVVQGADNVTGLQTAEMPVAPPAPAPREIVRLHSGIDAPKKVFDVAPRYPDIARQAHVEGMVIIEATISERGDVIGVRILRSIPTLDRAAVDAVTQWKFTPARLNGEAIPVVMTITVNFALKQ